MDRAKAPKRADCAKFVWVVSLLFLDRFCDLIYRGLQRLVFGPEKPPKGAYWARNERGQWELRAPYRGEKSPPKWRY